MSYVLIRNEDGAYVAVKGFEHSYTRNLRNAEVFPTREQAERGKCDNETAVSVESQMRGYR